ncbi:MAG: hypothetical protein ACI9O6_000915 [Glaciecola sp.]|jgi:hypothetical protein
METPINSKKPKRKFKQTKQLIRLALNDGWTQNQIKIACRVQQSIVSAWKNGTKQATEQQVAPLLEQYGHKLRKNSFRVYWSFEPETNQKVFHKVEGKVILSHVFFDARRVKHKLVKKIPQLKLVIHHQGDNKFRIVFQSRLKFQHSNDELESIVENAVWNSKISEQTQLPDLLDAVDEYAESALIQYPSDANTLPFITRQALLNYGFVIDGVVEYPAIW